MPSPIRIRSKPRPLILVADSSGARLLHIVGRHGSERLVEIATLEQPAARLPGRALVTDRTGRVFPRGGRGSGPQSRTRHGAQSDYDPHDEETARFARRLARRLDAERRSDAFSGLKLIAAKHFLGVLRAQLSAPTQRWVEREVAKDLLRAPDAQILREALR